MGGWKTRFIDQLVSNGERHWTGFGLDSSDIAKLAALSVTDYLNVSLNSIDHVGAAALAKNPYLYQLDISYNAVGDIGAKALFKASLRYLNISGNSLSPSAMSYLADSRDLECLFVSDNLLGNVGALEIAKHQTLQALFAINCGIDDDGIEAITRMPKLEVINVAGNCFGERGHNALLRLKAERPPLRIEGMSSRFLRETALEQSARGGSRRRGLDR